MAIRFYGWPNGIVSQFGLVLVAPCLILSRAVIGSLGSSFLADKIGRKPVFLIAFVVMLVGITLETVATTNGLFFGGKFINGFSVGAFGAISMTYLGEVCASSSSSSSSSSCL